MHMTVEGGGGGGRGPGVAAAAGGEDENEKREAEERARREEEVVEVVREEAEEEVEEGGGGRGAAIKYTTPAQSSRDWKVASNASREETVVPTNGAGEKGGRDGASDGEGLPCVFSFSSAPPVTGLAFVSAGGERGGGRYHTGVGCGMAKRRKKRTASSTGSQEAAGGEDDEWEEEEEEEREEEGSTSCVMPVKRSFPAREEEEEGMSEG